MTDRRRLLRTVSGATFLVVAVGLAGLAVWKDRRQLVDGLERLPVLAVIGSFLLAGCAVAATFPMWHVILRGVGAVLPLRPAARVFFVAQLGKYLPGSVWPVLAQMELGRRFGVPRARMLAGGVLTIVVNVAVGGVLACLLLPFVSRDALSRFWWLPVALPFLLVALHPRIVIKLTNAALAVFRRPPMDVQLGFGSELRGAGWGLVSWAFVGAHIYVLTAALGATGLRAVAASVAAGCLALAAGTLFVPAPAGAGVRELAFVVSLSTVLPAASALLVALLSRLMLIVLDLAFAASTVWLGDTVPAPPQAGRVGAS